jgi:hypothetical protein
MLASVIESVASSLITSLVVDDVRVRQHLVEVVEGQRVEHDRVVR